MKRLSDQQCLALLVSRKNDALDRDDIYKACVALSNNGIASPFEGQLGAEQRRLLEARRIFKSLELEKARKVLGEVSDGVNSALYECDRFFLLANLTYRQGDKDAAAGLMLESASWASKASDPRRELRALINERIYFANAETCTVGELMVLEQQARREGYHDLIGAVQRTRAMELLRVGRLSQALPEAWAAVSSYELDGFPEDRAVAFGVAAILELLSGNAEAAKTARNRMLVTDGRVAPYCEAFDTLISGRVPKFPPAHPLRDVPWKQLAIKPASVPARIIARLRKGPATRDELIEAIWGTNATHSSYQSRLYSNLTTARKVPGVKILFDGERYCLG